MRQSSLRMKLSSKDAKTSRKSVKVNCNSQEKVLKSQCQYSVAPKVQNSLKTSETSRRCLRNIYRTLKIWTMTF